MQGVRLKSSHAAIGIAAAIFGGKRSWQSPSNAVASAVAPATIDTQKPLPAPNWSMTQPEATEPVTMPMPVRGSRGIAVHEVANG